MRVSEVPTEVSNRQGEWRAAARATRARARSPRHGAQHIEGVNARASPLARCHTGTEPRPAS